MYFCATFDAALFGGGSCTIVYLIVKLLAYIMRLPSESTSNVVLQLNVLQ